MYTTNEAGSPGPGITLPAGVTLSGLAIQTGIDRNALRRKLANPDYFTVGQLREVTRALDLDPTPFLVGGR